MQYRELKKLGIKVSAFGIGCMRFPSIDTPEGKKVDLENAKKIIRMAIDQGVNYVDTAYVYSDRTNESIVGEALSEGYREKVYLATKLPSMLCEKADDMQRFFDEQLAALRTDYIDFYLVHALDRKGWDKMKGFGVREFLDKLKAEGKIKYACFSFHDNYDAYEYIIKDYDWDMSQIQYNYMDCVGNAPGERGLRLAESMGIPVVIMEGLLGGKLASVPDDVKAVFDEYSEDRSAVEWAFRWLCDDEAIGTVLSGVLSPEMTQDNIDIFSRAHVGCMSEEEKKTVERAREVYAARIKVGCTACRYCMPCPMGVDIPKIFSIWNDSYKYGNLAEGKRRYAHALTKELGADRCVGCGACEAACPQHIDIRDMLQVAHKELT